MQIKKLNVSKRTLKGRHKVNGIFDNRFKTYRKVTQQHMRPYEQDEDMTNIAVDEMVIPRLGGMIAIDPSNLSDRWYVTPEFFEANYKEVL